MKVWHSIWEHSWPNSHLIPSIYLVVVNPTNFSHVLAACSILLMILNLFHVGQVIYKANPDTIVVLVLRDYLVEPINKLRPVKKFRLWLGRNRRARRILKNKSGGGA